MSMGTLYSNINGVDSSALDIAYGFHALNHHGEEDTEKR